MDSTPGSKDKVTETFSSLTLETAKSNGKPVKSKAKSKPEKKVVDSWEDDDESSDPDEELRAPVVTSPVASSAPPPVPFEATYGSVPSWNHATNDGATLSRQRDSTKRPEKTDAVARRMIAASLGLKAPKQTEEQRTYQKSVREQEKKKREQEKLEEQRRREESEMAKAAVWED
ncbi:hypothetical protein E4U54_005617 [Claviceps lovelessii]|nr:hypothetical protein E4U54_005617 [Claviceps lovelessii]